MLPKRLNLRVALVHDWLLRIRGGERVLDELAAIFPNADLYTLIYDPRTTTERIENLHIIPSPLSSLPYIRRYYRMLAPVFPSVIEGFDLNGYDLVVSSSHSFAKGVHVPQGTPHLCYCHTPIRYIWGLEDAYLGKGLRRRFTKPVVARLQRWDRITSSPDRVSRILANSHYIAERIRRAWQREADVVYPGIDSSRFHMNDAQREDFFLIVGGFVPYKAEGLAVEAFRTLRLPLLVAGDGPARMRLQSSAPSNVRFLGRVTDRELADLYARCRALIYPQEEDFGLVAVEAQAAGAPVIAFGRGGAVETVVPFDDPEGRAPTGVFFTEATPDSLAQAICEFETLRPMLKARASRENAERFSVDAFRGGILGAVEAIFG